VYIEHSAILVEKRPKKRYALETIRSVMKLPVVFNGSVGNSAL